jgi:hypothetical protein
MKDGALHLEGYLPNGGGILNLSPMDLGVDQPGFSQNFRQGHLRVTIPAMPNFTNNANAITVTLQDSADYGATFQNCAPLAQFQLSGVAGNGTSLFISEMEFPPGLRGPVGLQIVVPASVNTNDVTGIPALLKADWADDKFLPSH